MAKVVKNGKPDPKKAAKQVQKIYASQESKNEKRFQSDLKDALDYDEKVKKMGSSWGYRGKTAQSDLRRSRMAAGKAAVGKTARNIHSRKESGAYKSDPHVIGGTKKMIKRAKKNVRKSSASKQAKRSAKKLY